MKVILAALTSILLLSSTAPLTGCGGGGGGTSTPQSCCHGTTYDYQTQRYTTYSVPIGGADDKGMVCTAARAFFVCN